MIALSLSYSTYVKAASIFRSLYLVIKDNPLRALLEWLDHGIDNQRCGCYTTKRAASGTCEWHPVCWRPALITVLFFSFSDVPGWIPLVLGVSNELCGSEENMMVFLKRIECLVTSRPLSVPVEAFGIGDRCRRFHVHTAQYLLDCDFDSG